MKRLLTAVVLIPVVLLVLFKAPLWLFTLVVGVVALGGAWEYLKLVDGYGIKASKQIVLGMVALIFVGVLPSSIFPERASNIIAAAVVFLFPLILMIDAMRSENLQQALLRAACSFLAIPYVALTLACLPLLRQTQGGVFLIVFMFAVVWSGDIFAYYAGRAFGKRKLAPRISPGKTWEGTIASLLGSVLIGHLLFVNNSQVVDFLVSWNLVWGSVSYLRLLPYGERFLTGVVFSVLINIAAQLGDLVESMIKRGAGVKDSGGILPGHGGILDRIDALLFAAPIVMLYAVYAWLPIV